MPTPALIFPEISDGEDKSSPFKNCLRNNYRHLRKFAKRTNTNCFRLYDREIPHYPLAIDYYDNKFCIHYFSKVHDDEEPSSELEKETEETLYSLFKASPEDIFWRTRARRRKLEQYEKNDNKKSFFTVYEYGAKFQINLTDYLDTGLFLDHRETRHLVSLEAKGKKLLNLFAYTSSFSVHAALQGALSTKSVDMSNTYCEWGRENFLLNNLPLLNNEIIRADCMVFLQNEVQTSNRYDLIVIDPPTISRSKKMEEMFDIQKDYSFLLNHALKLLSPGGTIFFSTNSRKFTLDKELFSHCQITEITDKTIPLDFHNKKIHQAWKINSKTTNVPIRE